MASKKRTAGHSMLAPDPIYDSLLVTKFINCLMWQGKKSIAQKMFYDAMDQIKKKAGDGKEFEIFEVAVENVKPSLEVRSKRVGGANYQVPMPVKRERQQSLAIRWLINASRSKKGKPMFQKLADEFMAAYRREGEAMAKRETTIKMAEANKAFSHFAW
ncbi:MAG TPA: 30S ribosomal protein S7 [Gemmatales bacterium]|jgi:small subunit ribosomal protein S7|nr:30S ribosomal protein S7 [Gemmatales bacterium]